ncbi:MAG TPA: hypothetical protein VFZ24_17950 [Longimicrobiales bacterium]
MRVERHGAAVALLREAVLRGPGVTDAKLRAAVESHAARLSGRSEAGADAIPQDVAAFVEKVALHAWRIADEDIAALRRAGWTEDAVFEIAASAALGAGVGRLERGLAALRGEV